MNTKLHPIFLFGLIVVMGTIGVIANDVFSPAMPSVLAALDTNKSLVQLTVTCYMFAFCIAQLFYGPLSDRFGRRRMVMIGFSIAWFGTLICYLSSHIGMLMVGRAVQGLGMSAGVVIYRAMMRDVYGKWAQLSRFASYIMIAIALILMASLALGGYLQQYFGWRANFVFMLGYILFFLIVMFAWLPETNRYLHETPLQPRILMSRYWLLFSNAQFMGAALMAGLSYSSILIYLIESPFLLQHVVGLSPVQYGWTAFAIAGCLGVANILNSVIVSRVGTYAMLLSGAIIMLVAALLCLLAYAMGYMNAWVIVLPGGLFIFGVGLLFENATSTALSPYSKMAGTAGATYGFTQILVASIMSALISIPHDHTQRAMSMMFLFIALACLVLCIYFVSRGGKGARRNTD
ncbi:MAG: multidrug effflux MFS transporter [Coxiellaceae bacterium]|nr:multidrug effflux MFS transporter [Coxiellaceae bacterium]